MIYGIRPPTTTNVGGVQPNRQQQPATPSQSETRIDQRRAPATVPSPHPLTAPASPNGTHTTPAAVPPQAPPGTDPELWNVLSAEERVFFAKLGAMGPLTYGRVLSQAQQAPPPAARGGRLDVKA
jgi:hypothetical protein